MAEPRVFLKENRGRIEENYLEQAKNLPRVFAPVDEKLQKCTEEVALACKYLYAFMPYSDIGNYPFEVFLDYAENGVKLWKENPQVADLPEEIFLNYVLFHRVNEEEIAQCRTYFRTEIGSRIQGMNFREAALEVNYWCAEEATYHCTDDRTLSAISVYRRGNGRCGEESVFTVNALRSVGVPARQVYAPKWSHCDDNHAWVEIWCDGKWYFLGACEPEPVLNLGWFNAPASRAMLMHTRVFGNYNGPEEVLLRTNNFTEINLTSNYAPTAEVKFEVKDTDGNPVNGAKVEFKIYNYAEYYTAVTKRTDAQGRTSLSAGKGDLLIWASKDGKYGYSKASFGKDNIVTITLNHSVLSDKSKTLFDEETFNIVPPVENVKTPYVSDEMRKENNRRFAYEDSIRKAYTATFLTKEQAEKINPRATEYLVKSRGNKQTIIDFLTRHKDNEKRALGVLSTLSDKDLRDIPMEILEDNFTAKTNQLSPRVEDEMISIPFKNYFEKAFAGKTADMFRKDPTALVSWINKNLRIAPEYNALHIAQTPVGVMESKTTDERSRDIFFVDVARSLGIEARKDAITGKVQYMKDGKWMDVKFESKEQAAAPTGKLVLTYKPSASLDDPRYYNHFTISRIVNGSPKLMNFEEGQADMGNGTCWSNTFKNGYSFDTGTYMLTTGTRLASGSVLAATRFFNIEEGKTTTLPLDIRHDANDVSVIGQFNSESIINKDGKDVSILSQTGRGYYILAVLGVGQEPTNHALHDIEKERAAFESWGRPVVLLFESEADAKKFQKDEFGSLPSTVQYAIDKNGAIREQIAREMKLQNKTQMPMFIIADTFNRVVFSSQGYTIGLGEQMKNVFKKL